MIITANLKPALSPEEVKKAGVANIRESYNKLAADYNRILDGDLYFCHCCNEFHRADAFYNDKRYATGLFPECKESLKFQACDYDKKTKTFSDNREKTIEVFHKLDLPFIESEYQKQKQNVEEKLGEKNRSLAYLQLLVMVKSLDQYKNLHWKDSDFGADESPDIVSNSSRKPRKEIQKLFGSGFTNEEYLYLQDQYDDWCARTQVDSKSQQLYVVRICFKLLDIWKAQRRGEDTTKLDDSLNKLMDAAKLQPKQNAINAATDSLTFGELIAKWEANKPIPEPDPELTDPSSIGKNLRVWFAGWLGHALGLNVPVTKEYEEEVAKYTVNKPDESEQGTSSALYGQLFGVEGE